MKLLQFAVASIVDANTDHGLIHTGSRIDYAAAERRGRSIRAKTVSAQLTRIKTLVTNSVSAYRERARQRRSLVALTRLNDHYLQDIGLSRGDLIAVRLGHVTLEQLNARRYNARREQSLDLVSGDIVNLKQELGAVNAADYTEAKCA